MRNHRRIIAGEEISRFLMGEHERGIKIGFWVVLLLFLKRL